MSETKKTGVCAAAPKLIFACSGAADVGALTDLAARQLTREGVGKMYCLTGVGGRVDGIMKTVEKADQILVLDGCPLNCARKTLETAGFNRFHHIELSGLGLAKGQSPATDENLAAVMQAAKKEMASFPAS